MKKLCLILGLLLPALVSAQPLYQFDLRDLMDAHYPGGWTQWGATGTGSDIGPAIIDGLTACRASFGGVAGCKIKIPPGQFLMATPPGETLLSGNYIEGSGSQSSIVIFRNTNDVAFYWSGRGYSGGGISGVAIMLEAGQGNTNSYAVLLMGTASYQPGQMAFRDLYIDGIGNSQWVHAFYAYGSARTSPLGIRGVTMENVQLFKSWGTALSLFSAVEWNITGGGCFVGDPNLYITNSTEVYGTNLNCTATPSGPNPAFWLNGSFR